ncbi:MAG TPA: glycosyltransferase [Streptosporangiaceae bacterium]|nr:glycosyltransferase [Streptosporangiaceae bacterium]
MRIAMVAYTLYACDPRVKRAACALAENGYQVDVFSVYDGAVPEASQDSEPSSLHLLRMRKKQSGMARLLVEYGVFFAWASARVGFLHVRRGYDIVYVHNMPNFLVFTGLLPKLGGAKIVLDVHDPGAELLADMRGHDLGWFTRRLLDAEERTSISFADALITVNEAMRRRLATVTAMPVKVVMNLPDHRPFDRPSAGGGAGDLAWLVYSGSVAHRNGVDLIVTALSMLADEFGHLRLRIVGDGPALAPVRRLAEELGVTDRVQFSGFVPSEHIPALVRGAVAGISAQRGGPFGSLVFSMKVPDYVALGLPVICSGIATMRHYFSDGELLFFEPDDAADLARAIRALLADPAAAAERAVRARVKLDKLDWTAQKETLVKTVNALAGIRGR